MFFTDRNYKNILFCAMVCKAVDYIMQRALLEEQNHYHCPVNKLVTLCSDLYSISPETHSKP